MVIEQLFTFHKKPRQFIYAAEDHLHVYNGTQKGSQPGRQFEDISLYESNRDELLAVKKELAQQEVGIILNSAHFIFNIFSFDRLPLRGSLKKELIEWRLKKIFPEDLDLYEHQYFSLKRTRILSVLFKNDLRETIEENCRQIGLDPIYLGNSTIEIINKMRQARPAIDFMLEVDSSLAMMVFQQKSCPIYIRKIRSSSNENMTGEILKTIDFVKTNYDIPVRRYALFSNYGDASFIREALQKEEMVESIQKKPQKLMFPG